MNNPLAIIKTKWARLALTALTGAIVATGVVTLIISEKIGAIQLAQWQIAAIYVAMIAGSTLIGLKDCSKKYEEESSSKVTGSSNAESNPS